MISNSIRIFIFTLTLLILLLTCRRRRYRGGDALLQWHCNKDNKWTTQLTDDMSPMPSDATQVTGNLYTESIYSPGDDRWKLYDKQYNPAYIETVNKVLKRAAPWDVPAPDWKCLPYVSLLPEELVPSAAIPNILVIGAPLPEEEVPGRNSTNDYQQLSRHTMVIGDHDGSDYRGNWYDSNTWTRELPEILRKRSIDNFDCIIIHPGAESGVMIDPRFNRDNVFINFITKVLSPNGVFIAPGRFPYFTLLEHNNIIQQRIVLLDGILVSTHKSVDEVMLVPDYLCCRPESPIKRKFDNIGFSIVEFYEIKHSKERYSGVNKQKIMTYQELIKRLFTPEEPGAPQTADTPAPQHQPLHSFEGVPAQELIHQCVKLPKNVSVADEGVQLNVGGLVGVILKANEQNVEIELQNIYLGTSTNKAFTISRRIINKATPIECSRLPETHDPLPHVVPKKFEDYILPTGQPIIMTGNRTIGNKDIQGHEIEIKNIEGPNISVDVVINGKVQSGFIPISAFKGSKPFVPPLTHPFAEMN